MLQGRQENLWNVHKIMARGEEDRTDLVQNVRKVNSSS